MQSGFSREEQPARTNVITFRVTDEEKAVLIRVAAALGLRGQSAVVRYALDYFLANDPAAKRAVAGKKG